MNKTIILIVILIAGMKSLLFAGDNDQSFCYYTLGSGPYILNPNIGLGYRSYHGPHGWDASLNLGTIGIASHLQAGLFYHHVFQPDCLSFWYAGAGASLSLLDYDLTDLFQIKGKSNGYHKVYLSPTLTLGKQYRTDSGKPRFIEVKVSSPKWTTKNKKPLPNLILHWGSSF